MTHAASLLETISCMRRDFDHVKFLRIVIACLVLSEYAMVGRFGYLLFIDSHLYLHFLLETPIVKSTLSSSIKHTLKTYSFYRLKQPRTLLVVLLCLIHHKVSSFFPKPRLYFFFSYPALIHSDEGLKLKTSSLNLYTVANFCG